MEILYLMLFSGIIAGFSYTILKNLVMLLNSNKIACIICDIVSMLVAGFCLTYSIIRFNNGVLRLYILCAFLLGFLIEIVSIGNLVDFSIKFVYNKFRLVAKNIRQKRHSRRVNNNGTKKIK